MLAIPQTLSIVTTYQCTAQCSNCCFNCNPKEKTALTKNEILEIIRDAQNIPTINTIVLTGGEVFLYKNDLIEIISFITNLGFNSRCVSNAYWASNESLAYKVLLPLQQAGLRELNLSYGDEHAKYVKPENVVNAIRVSIKLGILCAVNIETRSHTEFGKNDLLKYADIIESINNKSLILIGGIWMSNDSQQNHSNVSKLLNEPCEHLLEALTVLPDKKIMSCCGLSVKNIPQLQLGIMSGKESLKSSVVYAKNDLMKMAIKVWGPAYILRELMKLISKNDKGKLKNITHPCQICQFLYTNKKLREPLSSLLKFNQKDIIGLYTVHIKKYLMALNL